jgi:hypothetical protein
MKTNDIRIITIYSPLADEQIKELEDVFEKVFHEAFKDAQRVGLARGITFTTKAYCDLDGRYFRMTLKFRARPPDVILQNIDEITKVVFAKGIEKEKRKHPDSSGWLDV